MKNFWKMVLASALGVLLLSIVLSIFFFTTMASMVAAVGAASKSAVTVEPNSILDINMSDLQLVEQTVEQTPFDLAGIGANGVKTIASLGILDAVKALETAAADPAIKMVYLRPDAAGSISHLEEFRQALQDFRESGKPVITYMQTPTNAGFYLGSVADRIYLSSYHGGMNMLVGLSGSMIFLKDLLDKLGVNMQLIRHGKYKSAGEMYIRNKASEENLEQNTVLIKSIWGEIAQKIASRSGISTDALNDLLDNLSLAYPEDFTKYALVNELVTMQQMKDKLSGQMGVGDFDDINSISIYDYAGIRVKTNYRMHDKIAVIYVDGEIVDGREEQNVAGKRFADIIDKVANDNGVKAAVLRVNSPGGSVIAASQIKDAVDRLKEKKPVVASYGDYAASGGYWISAGADYIFSDATTLTGSIGVFGIIPDFSGTAKNIAHINVTSVPSNKHSDMFSTMRPLSDEEVSYVRKDIEAIYGQFTSLVAQGRNMDVEKVDELGQGRVWTGKDALANGLVDRIGGLKDALEYTAEIAGLSEYRIVSYPAVKTQIEMLMEQLQNEQDDYLVDIASDFNFIPGLNKGTIRSLLDISKQKEPVVYARMPYEIAIK